MDARQHPADLYKEQYICCYWYNPISEELNTQTIAIPFHFPREICQTITEVQAQMLRAQEIKKYVM